MIYLGAKFEMMRHWSFYQKWIHPIEEVVQSQLYLMNTIKQILMVKIENGNKIIKIDDAYSCTYILKQFELELQNLDSLNHLKCQGLCHSNSTLS